MNINKDQSGFTHLLALLVAVVVIVGVGFFVFQRTQNAKQSHKNAISEPTKVSTLVKALPSDLLTAEKVKELATAEKPKTEVLGIQLEMENGVIVYKVKLSNGSLLSFNAKTGKKVAETESGDKESELEGKTSLPSDLKPSLSFAKARDIAIAVFPKSTVSKIELELEDGTLVYSVRFSDGARVDVNANDGAVVKTKAPKSDNKNESNTSGKKGSSSEDSGSGSGSTQTAKPDDSTNTPNPPPSSGSGETSHSGTDSGSGGGTSGGGTSSGGSSGSGHDGTR